MSVRPWPVGVFLGVLIGGLGACSGRPLFDKARPMVERTSATIPPGRYRVLTTVAGGGATRIDFQISATVRQQLEDSGVTVVRRAGRWTDELMALQSICAPDAVPAVDGVLFIWYDRLELRDCATQGTAFEIAGGTEQGITAMTDRLIVYLRRPPAPAPVPAPSPDTAAAPPVAPAPSPAPPAPPDSQ